MITGSIDIYFHHLFLLVCSNIYFPKMIKVKNSLNIQKKNDQLIFELNW